MLSKKQTGVIAILLGASLAAAWLDGSSLSNLPHYEKQNPSEQRANAKSAEIRPDERIANYTWWLAVLTGALVIASIGQGCFLLRADKTARMTATAALKSADTAEKDLLASHRPLITITSLDLCGPNDFRPRPHIVFAMRNSGKGLAVVNKIGLTLKTVDGQQRQHVGFIAADWNGALEAGETSDGHRVESDLIGPAEYELLQNGKLALFATFEVLTQDIFHNPLRQMFPFVYQFRARRFERSPSQWEKQDKPYSS